MTNTPSQSWCSDKYEEVLGKEYIAKRHEVGDAAYCTLFWSSIQTVHVMLWHTIIFIAWWFSQSALDRVVGYPFVSFCFTLNQ